jgi:PKD repeat protein
MKLAGFNLLLCIILFIAKTSAINPEVSTYLKNLSASLTTSAIKDANSEMVISGNKIHIVWIQFETNNYKLYYIRSVNLGNTWETPRLITLFKYPVGDFASNAANRKLAVDGENVHIAICDMDFYNGFASKVYYFRSTDGGTTFEPVRQLASKGGDGGFNSIHINAVNGKVAIVYKGTPNAKSGLFMLASVNNGLSFTETTIFSANASLTDFWYDGNQMIVLYEYYVSDYRAWVAISNDAGATFVHTKLLNENGEEKTMRSYNERHYAPKIAKWGNNIHLVYAGYNKNNQLTTFYARSSDNGQTFSKVTDINNGLIAGSNLQTGMENVLVKNGQLYLAYLSKTSQLYMAVSADNGNTVSPSKGILPEGFDYVGTTSYPGLVFDSSDATGQVIYVYGYLMNSAKSTDGGKTFSNFTRLFPFFHYFSYLVSDLIIDSDGNKHWVVDALIAGGSDIDVFYRKLSSEPEPGPVNQSLSVTTVNPGKQEVVIVPSSQSLDFDTALTAEAWVKFDLASIGDNMDVSLFAKVNGLDLGIDFPNGFQVILRKRFGKMCMSPGIKTDKGDFVEYYNWYGENGIGDTLWHHIAISYDAKAGINNFRTYVDGLLVGKQTVTGKLKQGNGLFIIGTRGSINRSSKFQIDDIRLWNRALTQEELLQNQVKKLTGKEDGLKMFLNFNGSFKDMSGNGNDGIPIYTVEMPVSDFNPPLPEFDLYQNLSQISLTNKTQNGKTYHWRFGDGTTSDKGNPYYVYPKPGEYEVILEAANTNSKTVRLKKVTIAGIDRIEPKQAGNGGFVSISVYGGGLSASGTTISLRKAGETDIKGFALGSPGSGILAGLFNLNGKTTGKWDIVINMNGVEQLLKDAFTVVAATLPDPWINVSGRNAVIINKWHTFTINYGNNGNVDAFGVPMTLAISIFPGSDVELIDFEIQPNTYMKKNYPQITDNIDSLFFIYKDYFGAGSDARIYPMIIPVIEANSSHSIHIRVKSPQSLFIESWINSEMFETVPAKTKSLNMDDQSILDDDLNTKEFTDSKKLYQCLGTSWANLGASFLVNLGTWWKEVTPLGCIYNIATGVYNPIDQLRPSDVKKNKVIFNSPGYKWGAIFTGCAVSLTAGPAVKTGWAVCKLMLDIGKAYNQNDECRKAYDPLYKSRKGILAVFAFDPNEMIGPSGFGAENWIQKNTTIPYTVLFENKSTATAPAHEVFITDSLDLQKFDFRDFGFGAFGFGDTMLVPTGKNLRQFSMDIDLRPKKNLITRVSGKLDTITGVIRWKFASLNPTTMNDEEDPFTGFLPPNNASGAGEGFVSFSAGLKKELKTNDKIKNKASIVFDTNAPIMTNEFVNTLDLDKPESKVLPLEATIKNRFPLSWTGSDSGSGVAFYDIYVMENDTALRLWKSQTTLKSAEFTGNVGSKYKFYSIATDNVSLVEQDPGIYDAQTTITVDIEQFETGIEKLKVWPNPVKDNLNISYAGAPSGMYVIEILNTNGLTLHSKLYSHFELSAGLTIDTKKYSRGSYLLRIVFGNKSETRKIVIK